MPSEPIGIREQDLAFLARVPGEIPVLDQRGEKKVTRDSEKDAVDINQIMKRLERTGELPPAGSQVYGDFSELGDYQSVMERVRAGEAAFAALPAGIRAKFENDPVVFLDFLQTADEKALVDAGLVQAPPEVPGAAATAPVVP